MTGKKRKRGKDPPKNISTSNQGNHSISESSDSSEIHTETVIPPITAPTNDVHYDPNGSFVVISPTNGANFQKIGPFWIFKEVQALLGPGCPKVETPRDGSCIIKSETPAQTKKLLTITKFCEQPVKVYLHETRNQSKGIIFASELNYLDATEICEGFASEGVTDVRRISNVRDGVRRPTSLLVLTFQTSCLPTHVKAGYLRYEIRPFIPNPLRCFNCQQFGHGSRHCRRGACCVKCGLPAHEGSQCSSPQRCVNCGSEEHAASSNKCPKWQAEKRICEIKVTQNISYRQAREVFAKQTPKISYATKLQTIPTVKKVSIAVQTMPLDSTMLKPLPARSDPTPTRSTEENAPVAPSKSVTRAPRPSQKCHRLPRRCWSVERTSTFDNTIFSSTSNNWNFKTTTPNSNQSNTPLPPNISLSVQHAPSTSTGTDISPPPPS